MMRMQIAHVHLSRRNMLARVHVRTLWWIREKKKQGVRYWEHMALIQIWCLHVEYVS